MSEITPELIFHELRERAYSGKETRKVTLFDSNLFQNKLQFRMDKIQFKSLI